jgi:hypothetical protein
MNLILNNIEEFTAYVPTATGSDLNELKPFVEETEFWLKNELLGYPLYYRIQQISENPEESVFDGTFDYTFDSSIPPSDICKSAKLVICLHAYLTAIPFVDLVQTPNGFAVVNNSNQAPASKERVERLIGQVEKRMANAIDSLILFAFGYSEFRELWALEKEIFDRHSEIVYLTTKELRNFSANKEAMFKDLLASHPLILSVQAEIARYFSASYLDELIMKRRMATLSDFDRNIFSAIQSIVGLKLQKMDAYGMIEKLLNYMIDHPGEFQAYVNSAEYRLKVSQKYENEKQHPTFFFGG